MQARPAGGKGEADWLSEEGDLGSRQGMVQLGRREGRLRCCQGTGRI